MLLGKDIQTSKCQVKTFFLLLTFFFLFFFHFPVLSGYRKLAVEVGNYTMQINSLHEHFSFLEIQILINTEKDNIKLHIQHFEKYSELRVASMITEVYCIRHHITLFQEVNQDISILIVLDVFSG